MTATVFSTLIGKLAGKHPELGSLVREDGMILCKTGWKAGYSLRSDGKYRNIKIQGKWRAVHRLVAETFIPNPDGKPTVDHIDRNTTNNSLSNLRWATHSEQRENSSQVLEAMDLGVRHKDDPAEWSRRNARRLRNIKKDDPEWMGKEKFGLGKLCVKNVKTLNIERKKPINNGNEEQKRRLSSLPSLLNLYVISRTT